MYKILCFLLLSFTIISCKTTTKSENWDVKNTRNIDVTDSTYLAKNDEARKNLPSLLKSLDNKKSNNYDFYVKAQFSERENTEHLWFAVQNLNNANLTAILDNVPLNLKNLKLGDTIKLSKNKIEDWIIYKGDSILAGNYLGKVIQ